MEYTTEPKVYLVTRPSVDWEQVAAFLGDEGVPGMPESIRAGEDESAAIIEISARLCYMSYGRGRRDITDFINNLLSSKDGSVFEHVNYGFGFAYSQRSQRYVDETDGRFVVPPTLVRELGDSGEARAILEQALESASSSYADLVEALDKSIPEEWFESKRDRRKAVRQAARAVLPNATETKIFVTGNVRAWRHFIEMRGAAFADWEIREMAVAVLRLLQSEAPLLFGDFTIDSLPDGTEVTVPEYSKV
jgi:thymidylate synthase (FAD)